MVMVGSHPWCELTITRDFNKKECGQFLYCLDFFGIWWFSAANLEEVRNLNRWNFRYVSDFVSEAKPRKTRIYCIGDLAALGAIGSGGSLLYLTVFWPTETNGRASSLWRWWCGCCGCLFVVFFLEFCQLFQGISTTSADPAKKCEVAIISRCQTKEQKWLVYLA